MFEDTSSINSYATHANAVRAAQKVIGPRNIKVVIACNADGRFFPVAIGYDALEAGLHFHIAVTA
jgi:hypothetical protein